MPSQPLSRSHASSVGGASRAEKGRANAPNAATTSEPPPPAAQNAAPPLFHPWLQAALMRRLGAPARLHRCRAHWTPAAQRPLPRRAAIVVLLLPQLALVLLGLAAMALGWFWAPFFVATAVAIAAGVATLMTFAAEFQGVTCVPVPSPG